MCFERYYDITLSLDNDEFTRLFRAAMEYCFFGEVKQKLEIREEAMFAFIKSDIDRNNEKYAETCRKRREAINKRWNQEAKPEDTNDTNEYNSIQEYTNDTRDTKDKDKDKGKGKHKDKKDNPSLSPLDLSPLSDRSPELIQAVKDWLQYKKERNETYKETGQRKLISEILNNCLKFGDEAVTDVINQSMARNYRGIIFNWLTEKQGSYQPRPQQPTQQNASSGDRLLKMIREGVFDEPEG